MNPPKVAALVEEKLEITPTVAVVPFMVSAGGVGVGGAYACRVITICRLRKLDKQY